MILKNVVNIYHTGLFSSFSVSPLYRPQCVKHLFLYLQMWCIYSCFQPTCSCPISEQFFLSLSIIFRMDSFISLFYKNEHLHVTYWIVLKFRSILSCKKAKKNKGLHSKNVLTIYKEDNSIFIRIPPKTILLVLFFW